MHRGLQLLGLRWQLSPARAREATTGHSRSHLRSPKTPGQGQRVYKAQAAEAHPCPPAVPHQYLSSGKSGHIENDISSEIFARVSYSVSQNQSPFCISVVDFHSSVKKRGLLIQQCFGLEVRTHLSGLEHRVRQQTQT